MPEQDDLRFGERNALCGLITAVYEFADVSYQQRIWIDGNGPEVSSYSEALSMLFDDYRIEEFADSKARDFGFSDVEVKNLSDVAHVIDTFNSRLPRGLSDAEIVQREGWSNVVAAASQVLDSGVLDWLAENCDSFPMFPIDWRGRSFGGTWKAEQEHEP
jgi:hypothetical protein